MSIFNTDNINTNGLTSNGDITVTGNTYVSGSTISNGDVKGFSLVSTQSINDEGGEIRLSTSQTNTTLSGGSVTLDIYQNKLRFFETGGSNRGAYIDLTSASTGVGSNLLSGGGGEVNTASNLGTGTGLFAQKSGVDLQFKSLTSTGNTITLTNNSTTVNLELVPISYFTGGTVTGSTTFTNGLTTNTFSSTTINTTNIYVTGGTQSLFSGDSSVEMVRIIQNGSGDAFVVEDQANGDASHFVINGSGNTAIGLTAPLGNDKLTVSGNTTVYGTLSATTHSGDGSGLTNLPTPYGLIVALSTGNYLI